MDIKGKNVTHNIKIVKRRIRKIKKFTAESVLGVNKESIDIEKPVTISHGVQLRIHIAYIHDKSSINPAYHYDGLLYEAVQEGELQEIIKKEWKLKALPNIENIDCSFQRSKEKNMIK